MYVDGVSRPFEEVTTQLKENHGQNASLWTQISVKCGSKRTEPDLRQETWSTWKAYQKGMGHHRPGMSQEACHQ
ncbi:hypothetical protein OJAV_G00138290 [Oryzias javanicus]|uniref:Uncharacterized protein n=1 Tax=Oryzias javanicus TaxID=123683 RepID=A0A3S2PXB6_ORYJA|nr:hypothetical protein OJAV_G00138290 [Oryzias javanicus]